MLQKERMAFYVHLLIEISTTSTAILKLAQTVLPDGQLVHALSLIALYRPPKRQRAREVKVYNSGNF